MKEVDKGFELFYRNLSNRRKFIRTIWISIIAIPIFLLILITVEDKRLAIIYVIIAAIVDIWQLVTTYRHYRAEK
ncbi:MAG: hypothetical protein PHP50_13475 [Lachnospiraceae bacterium]|nr:hypothetical protein [Lachnospiraceae bacterium]